MDFSVDDLIKLHEAGILSTEYVEKIVGVSVGFLPVSTLSLKTSTGLLPLPSRRPLILGKRKNTGVFVNTKILEAATEKLKTEQGRVGTSLSQLVEILLWSYAGHPNEIIESPKTEGK